MAKHRRFEVSGVSARNCTDYLVQHIVANDFFQIPMTKERCIYKIGKTMH